MTRRRWWESEDLSVENEAAWFSADGLDFRVDEELLRDHAVVVFRGELRLGDRRVAANVVYPPSYRAGGQPEVVARELPVGRHRTRDGRLCLDHAVFGETTPMVGAEAVLRAERLWDLWENDPEQLRAEEVDAADPAVNYIEFLSDSAITIADIDVGDGQRGYFQLKAASLLPPLRAVVAQVRVSHPQARTVEPKLSLDALEGRFELNGAWRRLDAPPPPTVTDMRPWLEEHHRVFTDRQFKYARQQAAAQGQPDLPAVFGFVYPDAGPGRDETHDAWLFCVADPRTGGGYFARSFPLRTEERWLRQPQLQPLEDKAVAIIGAGALGSQVADLLAKAGVGRFVLCDYDYVTHGNRVRHQLDLRDIGRAKVRALRERLLAVNPWCTVEPYVVRVGAIGVGDEEGDSQKLDDLLFELVTSCDLIINASAHSPTGRHLSRMAFESGTPAVHSWVSAGAWGGRVLMQRPGLSGCWECLGLAQTNSDRYPEPVVVPAVNSDPDVQQVSERGCADLTFTGPGFELATAAAATARIAVQTLLTDGGHYPLADFDLATLQFRDATSATADATYTRMPVHPDCSVCKATP